MVREVRFPHREHNMDVDRFFRHLYRKLLKLINYCGGGCSDINGCIRMKTHDYWCGAGK